MYLPETLFQIKDVLELHKEACPSHTNPTTVTMSLDGVQESRSSNSSLDTFCISFKSCRNVYPVKVVKTYDRYKYDELEEVRNFLSDLNENNIRLDCASMDNPKRGKVKNCQCHSGTHPCEYCECPAVQFIDNTMTKRKLTWPPSTMNGRPRTITAIRRIVNSIENSEEPLPKNYLKGIKGRSPLLDQPNFDFILDTPCEYMHLVCLGTVKGLLEFTYKIGKKKQRKTNRKRSPPSSFNELIMRVLVVREFSRRCRNLDTSVFKAQEYRNVLLIFFPIVLENIPATYKKEHQLWLSLVFMIRACVLPNNEYELVSKESIIKACELFYNLYYELFGQRNCTYSIHVVGSHLLKVKGTVPLTERSAFKFESFYSEMKNMYQAGTKSTLKQILRNTMMKRQLEHHTCQKSIFFQEQRKTKGMEDNSLVYTYTDNKHEIYVITDINENVFTCKRQGRFEYKTPLLPNHDWKTVGVYKKGPIGNDSYHINKEDIQGKVINVLNMLITCPNNVLTEK